MGAYSENNLAIHLWLSNPSPLMATAFLDALVLPTVASIQDSFLFEKLSEVTPMSSFETTSSSSTATIKWSPSCCRWRVYTLDSLDDAPPRSIVRAREIMEKEELVGDFEVSGS